MVPPDLRVLQVRLALWQGQPDRQEQMALLVQRVQPALHLLLLDLLALPGQMEQPVLLDRQAQLQPLPVLLDRQAQTVPTVPLDQQVQLVQSRGLLVQPGQLVPLVQPLPLRAPLVPLEQAEQLGQQVLPDLPQLLPVQQVRLAQMALLDPLDLRVRLRPLLDQRVRQAQRVQAQPAQQVQRGRREVVLTYPYLTKVRK
jgi:hypothetical protein